MKHKVDTEKPMMDSSEYATGVMVQSLEFLAHCLHLVIKAVSGQA